MAEREGFEPSVRNYRTPAFQASPFDRSGTSPWISYSGLSGIRLLARVKQETLP